MKNKYLIYGALTLSLLTTLNNTDNVNAFNNREFPLNKEIRTDFKNTKTNENVVNIEDNNLLKAINKQLGRGEILDSVTIADMESLTTLNANNKGITSIKGIEKAINLTSLDLSENTIVDVSPISKLTRLKTLYLNNNQISDISSLENLTSLTRLDLYTNQISDISSLENLTSLTTLYLDNNQISDISSLENLTSLTALYLNNNQISNISPLQNLSKLTHLYLYDNQIEDITSLGALNNLEELHLRSNRVSNITALEGLTNLRYLHLGNNRVSDITSLQYLINLTELDSYNNQISDITALQHLTNLTYLNLHKTQLSDITAIGNLTNLNRLYLHDNQISDISILINLSNLRDLQLENNRILDISPLKNLKNLSTLNISNQNPIIEVGDFKTKTDTLDVFINNPIIGVNNKVSNITNISNNGIYENNKLKWNNLSLGSHSNTFNFSQEVKIGSATSTFSGTATINFNIIDGGAPESDHISDFDEDAFEIYTTVTATDLGEGVSHLIHKGAQHNLPYRFKYDVYNTSNNIVEVYDLAGNMAEYQVKLKDSDISTINIGVEALINKDNISLDDIKYFRTIVNELDESSNKDLLQDKLNSISITDTLERKTATANIDVYIKSENMLSMTLSTNSITFEDYSGVDDLSIDNAINISINSSLPYQLNSYLLSEIRNGDGTSEINKNLFNIKDSSYDEYKQFENINEKLILQDNCKAGNNLSHKIDLMLEGGEAHVADIYKTIIKFEAEQK